MTLPSATHYSGNISGTPFGGWGGGQVHRNCTVQPNPEMRIGPEETGANYRNGLSFMGQHGMSMRLPMPSASLSWIILLKPIKIQPVSVECAGKIRKITPITYHHRLNVILTDIRATYAAEFVTKRLEVGITKHVCLASYRLNVSSYP